MEHWQTIVKCEIHRALLLTLKMSTNNKRTDIHEHSMFTCLLQRHRLFASSGATSSGGGGADLVGPGAADLVLVLLLASASPRRALRRAVTALRRLRNRSSTSAHSVVALPTIVES